VEFEVKGSIKGRQWGRLRVCVGLPCWHKWLSSLLALMPLAVSLLLLLLGAVLLLLP
jgi:hypothetical protein